MGVGLKTGEDGGDGKLGLLPRLVAAVCGLGLLAVGAIAVFLGHDGAGTLGMEGVGALFAVVGVTGASIASFKVGDNEVVLNKVKQAQKAYSQGDDVAAQQIVTQLVQASTPSSTLVKAAFDRTSYESNVMSILRAGLPTGWELTEEVHSADYRFDALVSSPDSKHIVVEVFVSGTFTGGQLLSAVLNAQKSHILGVHAVLVVAASESAPGFQRLRRDLDSLGLPYEVIAWHPDQSGNPLTTALTSLVERIGSGPSTAE